MVSLNKMTASLTIDKMITYLPTAFARRFKVKPTAVSRCSESFNALLQKRTFRISPKGSLPVYSTKIAVCVVDNVLVIHQVDAKVVMLYDIFADSRTHVSAPLPLLIRGLPGGTSVPSSAESSEASTLSNDTSAANFYSDDWSFLVPDLVCDVTTGFLWKINLDLEAISASSPEVAWVLEFLQTRKLEANKAKHLCVELQGSIVIERRPLPVIFRAVNVLVSSFANSLKTGSYSKSGKPRAENSNNRDTAVKTQASSDSEGNANSSNGENLMASEDQQLNGSGSESQVTSAAIPPDELHTCVFASVEEEMTADASYLFAVILEFIRSANMEKIKVHPNVYVLAVRLLGRNRKYAELGQFILNKLLRDDLKSNQEQLVAVLNLLMHYCRNGLSEFLQR